MKADKKKIWLVLGISFVVLVIACLFLYSQKHIIGLAGGTTCPEGFTEVTTTWGEKKCLDLSKVHVISGCPEGFTEVITTGGEKKCLDLSKIHVISGCPEGFTEVTTIWGEKNCLGEVYSIGGCPEGFTEVTTTGGEKKCLGEKVTSLKKLCVSSDDLVNYINAWLNPAEGCK